MANLKPRVLVIGDLMLDEYHHLVDDRPNPEGTGRVYTPFRTDHFLAGAGAVAMLISSLGAAPVLIAAMETRSNGRTLRRLLEEAGVENATLEVDGVSLTTRSKCHARGKLLPNVIKQDSAAVLPRARIIERINAVESFAREEQKPEFAAIAVADYGKGAVGPQLVGELRKRCPKLPILVMPHAAADWKIYRGCDLLVCDRPQFESRLAHAVERPNHLIVIDVHRGAEWTWGCDGARTILRWKTAATETVDPAGSFETLLAALAVAQTKAFDMRAAIEAAMDLAEWQVRQLGIEPMRFEHGLRMSRPTLPPARSAYGPSPLACAANAWSAASALGNLAAEPLNLAASAEVALSPPENLLAIDDWKIIDLPEAVTHAETSKRHGRKIAVVEGSFETLGAGHLSTLRFAKRHADVLFVGLKSDDAIARDKGPGRPATPQTTRARLLAALPEVDWVVNFGGDTAALLEALAPDVLVGSGERRLPLGWQFARESKGAPIVV